LNLNIVEGMFHTRYTCSTFLRSVLLFCTRKKTLLLLHPWYLQKISIVLLWHNGKFVLQYAVTALTGLNFAGQQNYLLQQVLILQIRLQTEWRFVQQCTHNPWK